MKKIKLILSLIVMFAFVNVGFGQISGTGHDFLDGDAWNTMSTNKACGPCHTPHAEGWDIADAPLWSHSISTQTFTPYSSGTMDATPGTTFTGLSAACLGCHDGATNANAHKGGANDALIGAVTGNLGTDLSSSHPVGFTYNNTLAASDGGLYNIDVARATLGGATISATLLFGAGNDQVECASCHDAHSNLSPFMRLDNTNSELCLSCHNK